MKRKVVITGMGAITPLGNNVQTTWGAIVSGKSGIGYISLFDASTFPVQIAAEVKQFDPDLSRIPESLRMLAGRSTLLCIEAAAAAIADSGIDMSREAPERIGVSVGSDEEYLHFAKTEEIYDRAHVYQAFAEGQDAYIELLRRSTALARAWSFRKKADMASQFLSVVNNIQGPVQASHTACSSSGHAIGAAKRFIESGDCDIAVAGGNCSMLSEFSVAGFHLLGTLSTHNEDPGRSSRPFDLNRDGFILGEGAGILILEPEERARKRGARIYAELAGCGSSSNAYRLTDTPPDGRGGDLSMRRAMEDGGIDVSEIDYINAHGTGTQLNDKSETLSIKNVFGDRAYEIPISSSKSMLGHLVNASSAVELIITVCAVREGTVPPTANLETPDPACDLDYVPVAAREKKITVALSNSFAFGGQNATLAVKKYSG